MTTLSHNRTTADDLEEGIHNVQALSHDEENGVIDEDGDESASNGSNMGSQRRLSTKQKAAQAAERSTLGKQESQAISYLRCMVLLILFMVGATFVVLVFHFVQEEQQDQFGDFRSNAKQVTDSFNNQLKRILDAYDTLSTEITSYAIESGSTFPNVTLPDIEFKGANARITGDTTFVFYMPYVREETRVQWETYSAAHFDQRAAAYALEHVSKNEQDRSYGKETPEYEGFALDIVNAGTRNSTTIFPAKENFTMNTTYVPLWQTSPALPVSFLNYDLGQYPMLASPVDVSASTGEAVFGTFYDLTTAGLGSFDLILQSSQYRHSKERYEEDPMTPMVYPVFDRFGKEDRKVGGVMYTVMYWQFLMMGILPDNIHGIVCVLKNSNGQVHTFQINGGDAVHLGEGDSHDKDFNDLAYPIDLVTKLRESAGPESRSFTAADVNGQSMNYTLTLFPSKDLRAIFVNKRAQESAGTIAMTFVVAICLFLIYDYYVQRRQRIVLDRAVRATAVVSSLFPENVREQIINDEDNDPSRKPKRGSGFLTSTLAKSASNAPPLATKYPNCTVYFADLTGFTKWASTRQPEMVFQLLGTVFKEFDAVASKRIVFKVETIGDCYMAVTGLPNAQPDHAVLMAKFAHDCMTKLDQVVERLAPTLGEGTDDLALRTGMHSGEVTAGVLRGEKGRFQLFGGK